MKTIIENKGSTVAITIKQFYNIDNYPLSATDGIYLQNGNGVDTKICAIVYSKDTDVISSAFSIPNNQQIAVEGEYSFYQYTS